MELAGIVIESWKFDVFTRHLNRGGFKFVNAGRLATGMIVLKVETDEVMRLSAVIKAAHDECVEISGRTIH